MSKATGKYTDNPWKDKAISRNNIIRRQNKRLRELSVSRDGWKDKYQALSKNISLHNVSLHGDTRKATRHQYPIQMVLLMVVWQIYGGMSLRSVRHCFVHAQIIFALGRRVPSHTSIRNWVCKSGYYRVQREQSAVYPPDEQWAVIIDESISIGSQKILLMLGLPLSAWQCTKSLRIEDVRVLLVETAKEWKGEAISQRLEALGRTRKIAYVVSDNGCNLRHALRLSSLVHVPDCSHVLANALARQYAANEEYLSLSKASGALRRKWFLSKNVAYMPPVQRSKSRFQNIFPTMAWAVAIMEEWENIPVEARAELMFVKEREALILEMFHHITVINSVSKILKVEGFTAATKEQTSLLIEPLTTVRGQGIREEITTYLTLLSSIADPGEPLMCCSDIIESYFGKFKQKINPNSSSSMTEFVLTIANFAGSFDAQEIKDALEKVTCKELSQCNKNDARLVKRRKKILTKKCTKKTP